MQFFDPRIPALQGWLTEIFFFASIRTGGLNLKTYYNQNEKWPACTVVTFDPLAVIPSYELVWFKPLKWNQGGYDAVFIDKESKLVRIVQVTRGNSHKLKFQYFRVLLTNLKAAKYDFKNVDICLVVPEEKKKNFRHSEEGSMSFPHTVRILYIGPLVPG